MKRLFKKLAAVGTALTMILPMAACGGGSGATHSDTLKKTINVAFDAQPNTYDPHASGATAVAQVATWIFEKLFELDENGDIQNYTVTTHSTQISSADNNEQGVKKKTDGMIHTRKTICEITNQENSIQNERIDKEPDYIEAMTILCSGLRRV